MGLIRGTVRDCSGGTVLDCLRCTAAYGTIRGAPYMGLFERHCVRD
jgi:hypothetical protein